MECCGPNLPSMVSTTPCFEIQDNPDMISSRFLFQVLPELLFLLKYEIHWYVFVCTIAFMLYYTCFYLYIYVQKRNKCLGTLLGYLIGRGIL